MELQIRKKAYKIVGRKGRRPLVELTLRENEIITDEGKLVYFILKGDLKCTGPILIVQDSVG